MSKSVCWSGDACSSSLVWRKHRHCVVILHLHMRVVCMMMMCIAFWRSCWASRGAHDGTDSQPRQNNNPYIHSTRTTHRTPSITNEIRPRGEHGEHAFSISWSLRSYTHFLIAVVRIWRLGFSCLPKGLIVCTQLECLFLLLIFSSFFSLVVLVNVGSIKGVWGMESARDRGVGSQISRAARSLCGGQNVCPRATPDNCVWICVCVYV